MKEEEGGGGSEVSEGGRKEAEGRRVIHANLPKNLCHSQYSVIIGSRS